MSDLTLHAICPDCGEPVERAGWTCGLCADDDDADPCSICGQDECDCFDEVEDDDN